MVAIYKMKAVLPKKGVFKAFLGLMGAYNPEA
jgi:hypothetical protein